VRLLDRYIARTFLKVFLATLVGLTVLAVAFDFFGRVNHFLNPDRVEGTFAEGYSSFAIIALFYAAYLPFLLKIVLPFVTVGAGLLTLTQMLQRNEVFPVIAAGVSARRLLLPLFLCGFGVTCGHIAFQEYVVPALTREQVALRRFFSGDRTSLVDDLAHLRDGEGTVTRAGGFSFNDRSLQDVVIQRPWKAAGFDRWLADRLDPDGDAWVAPGGVEIRPAGVESVSRRLPPGARVDIGLSPGDVEALAAERGTSDLSYTQLARLASKFPERRHLRVALHKQAARPLSGFLLLLCGAPILLRTGRSYFFGAAVAFLLSAGYFFLDLFFKSLGDRGDLPPIFAAYFPIACLLSLAVARHVTLRT